jgi:hypothetical protein
MTNNGLDLGLNVQKIFERGFYGIHDRFRQQSQFSAEE